MSADELPTTRAVSVSYDPYSRHVCEARTTSGRPCRRIARLGYEWPTETHYICGTHSRGLAPASSINTP